MRFIRQLTVYFETHLPDSRRLSQNTIASYADAFELLFQFLQEKKGIPHYKADYKIFTPAIMDDFMLWMKNERGYSGASVRQRLSAVNSFMKSTADKKTEKRDLVLLSLFYESAARAQEICDLTVGDIRFGSPAKVKLIGNGSKAREIPISEEVANLLRYHLKEAEKKRDKPLFTSQLGGKMTTACIRNLVDKYVKAAKERYPDLFNEPKYSPHSFRHSKAVHMAESGTPLIYIRNFLGHASTKSTEIYARIGYNAVVKTLTERRLTASQSTLHVDASTLNKQKTAYPKFLDIARGK